MSPTDTTYPCPRCNSTIRETDDFCPECGALFAEGVTCHHHPGREAEGVCIICSLPGCTECGGRTLGRFLCTLHRGYEIVQGMARVYGNSDAAQIEFARSCLQTTGLHPFVFTRKASPLSLGGPDYSLFRASGEYDGHLINEFKLMVPCQEVAAAEDALRELNFLS